MSESRTLIIGASDVATYDLGFDVDPRHAPRPYLEVRTLGGLTVTEVQPDDHPWHLGLSIAVPDVNGWNLWGGPTYLPDDGYQWRNDHGRIEHVTWRNQGDQSLHHDLRWLDGHGQTLLSESRSLRWSKSDTDEIERCWILDIDFTLFTSAGSTVRLGSPGASGRAQAGYGGLFWRLPRVQDLHVRTPASIDETSINGSISPWVSASFRVGERGATILLMARDKRSAGDPWFVRAAEYPALGAALAWNQPLLVTPETPVRRRYRAAIADGVVDPELLAESTVPGLETPAISWTHDQVQES